MSVYYAPLNIVCPSRINKSSYPDFTKNTVVSKITKYFRTKMGLRFAFGSFMPSPSLLFSAVVFTLPQDLLSAELEQKLQVHSRLITVINR